MIGQDTIDRVRAEARIVEIVGERVKLERRGRSHFGLCPFHKEKSPSFHVSEERGFYHCFGCGASGDAIKFLREVEGLAFHEAVRRIAERQGIEIVETGSEEERRQQSEARRRREELYRINEEAAQFFERMLKQHPLARLAHAELERRGLDIAAPGPAQDALRAFRIGYAPYGWDLLSKHLRDQRFGLRIAEELGLVVARKSGPGYYDRFRHRLMFAVHDPEGRIIAWSGRALPEPSAAELSQAGVEPLGATGADAPAKYVNSPESPLYKKREAVFGLHQARQGIRAEDACVVVEGNFDVVSLHARGISNVVAPLGTAFTAEQAKKLRRLSANVVLLFDGDEAGRRAVRNARDICNEAGLVARVATLPEGTDPDELVRRSGPETLRKMIANSKSLLEHLIGAAFDRGFAQADARGRAAKIREVAELIASEADPTARAFAERHADTIAERLGIGDARTFRALASVVHRAATESEGRAQGERSRAVPPPPERARSRERRRDIALEIFGALLDFPSLLDSASVLEAVSALAGDVAMAVAALRQCSPDEVNRNPEQLLAKLPPSIHSFAAARLAAPRHDDVEAATSELQRNVEKLKRLELSRLTSEVMEELERLQMAGDFDHELKLLREQERRARERHGL